MPKALIQWVTAASFAIALYGCNEGAQQPISSDGPVNAAKDKRAEALSTLKADTDDKRAGFARDMVTVLSEDQASFDGVIERLKSQMQPKGRPVAGNKEPNAKEKRNDQK